MTDAKRLVDKLWAFCDVLRDDGVGVLEYTEQLTYLLFLKMAHERATRDLAPQKILPDEFSWQRLLDKKGIELEAEYTKMLLELGRRDGVIGTIFRKAQNRIQDPAKLQRLIHDLINKENWSASGTDINGDAYEALLAKGASDKGSGAGQYFTPRPLIQTIVDVVDPTVGDTVTDPACGTGGFLLMAHENARQDAASLTPTQKQHLRDGFIHGGELVDGTARLAAMNLLLHGVGSYDGPSPIDVRDSLANDPGRRWSVVLTNPPFGRKSSVTTFYGDDGETSENTVIERSDFVATTSNKQLNFLQHIMTILEVNGRAAVVLPDNVLFEGGAGETIRRKLLDGYDLHTMLRLPTGIFYAQGVKANVLFFDRKKANPGQHWTEKLWVYDLRTNQHFTLKQNPLQRRHLDEFFECYKRREPRSSRIESERFRAFTYDEIVARDKANLDITWLKDDSLTDLDSLPSPEVIAREIVEDLTAALAEFETVAAALEAQLVPAQIPAPSDPVD